MMRRKTCATCAHNGCCADLHHCGGTFWTPAEDKNDNGYDPWEGYDPAEEAEERTAAWLERHEP